MSNSLTVPAPAKLNLFLHITGRRPDGYHLLQTLFQLIDYGDTLRFDLRRDQRLTLTPAIAGVTAEENLVIKAAKLLQQQTHCALGADIQLQKKLPVGGGIGGGSSDAASTLLALNQLWALDLSNDQLAQLGLQLGADVPVFIRGRTAWAEGVGEQLQAIDIPETWYLVIKPECEVSTAQIFSHKQLTRNTSAITIAAFFEQGAGNDCEAVVCQLYPQVRFALEWLRQYTPAQLTGTGACVFGRFENELAAQQILEQLPSQLQGFVARGVNTSPALAALDLKH